MVEETIVLQETVLLTVSQMVNRQTAAETSMCLAVLVLLMRLVKGLTHKTALILMSIMHLAHLVEVTLYPQIYYMGGSDAMKQLALGDVEFVPNDFQRQISVADPKYARIQPVGCSTEDLQLAPVIGVAIFEDKAISDCDLNDVSLDNNDTDSVNTLFALPNQPINRVFVNGQLGSPIGTRRMNFLDLRKLSGYKRGFANLDTTIEYPEGANEATMPITFRATGSVSNSLRICPFATLFPVGLLSSFGAEVPLTTVADATPRNNSKTQHVSSSTPYQNIAFCGARFTGDSNNGFGLQPNTADGFYTIKASFFTV